MIAPGAHMSEKTRVFEGLVVTQNMGFLNLFLKGKIKRLSSRLLAIEKGEIDSANSRLAGVGVLCVLYDNRSLFELQKSTTVAVTINLDGLERLKNAHHAAFFGKKNELWEFKLCVLHQKKLQKTLLNERALIKRNPLSSCMRVVFVRRSKPEIPVVAGY